MIGKEFHTLEDLQVFVSEYSKANFIQLWISDSRTIEGARKRGFLRHVEKALRYTEISYKCIHSAKSRESRSTGKRPNQSTYRQNCPFVIRFTVTEDGKSLKVVKFVENHNHDCNKETFAFLPKQRKLEGPSEILTKHMLHLRANKKLLQKELISSQNKKVTLKDLHNLESKNAPKDTLEEALNYLKDRDGNIVELLKSKSNELLGIFYQDQEMRRVFNAYPEILFVDAIHKISSRNMPLYILVAEDGNGQTEIVGFYLTTNEDTDSIKFFANCFKKHNTSYTKTKCIMADKDFVERKVFSEELPDAKILICLFHCLRSFRREISAEKMGIMAGERDLCLEIIQELAYARNEEDYMIKYQKLKETNLMQVVEYFDTNWHPIRSEWVVSLQQLSTVTYGNQTNNRLESINSKVVQVVKRKSTISCLFRDLDTLVMSLRIERDNKAAQIQLKTPFCTTVQSAAQQQYINHLTPYAYGLLAPQFDHKQRIEVIGEEIDGSVMVSGNHTVTTDSCNCPFFATVQLPCKHILKVRELKSLNLFSASLVSIRWTKDYYLHNSRVRSSPTNITSEANICITELHCSTRILTQHEKFKQAISKTQKLASIVSEGSMRLFTERLKVLDDLINHWSQNAHVTVCVVDGDEPIRTQLNQLPSNVLPHVDNIETLNLPHTQSIAELQDSTGPAAPRLMPSHIENEQLLVSDSENHPTSSAQDEPHNSQALSTVNIVPTLPLKIKKRGRPKGTDKTVIGLPNKRRKVGRIVSFEQKHPKEKDKLMLEWFVSAENAKLGLNGKLLEEYTVEQNPNKVSSACLDENVCVTKLRKYFSGDAWIAVKHVLAEKKKSPLWLCPVCLKDSSDDSICCNSCLEWYHINCTNCSKTKKKQWFCHSCYKGIETDI